LWLTLIERLRFPNRPTMLRPAGPAGKPCRQALPPKAGCESGNFLAHRRLYVLDPLKNTSIPGLGEEKNNYR
jgi:hypothetical protein